MKKIGGCIYMHCSVYDIVDEEIKKILDKATTIMFNKGMLVEWLSSVVYKLDIKNNTVSMIESYDWDSAREPQVGDAYNINLNTEEIKIIKSKGQIYHHKWMFVSDTYEGFDIEESKKWSKRWQSVIPNDKKIKSRIGYKKYWDEYLKEYGLEVE